MKPGVEGDYLRYTNDYFNARKIDCLKLLLGFPLLNPAYGPEHIVITYPQIKYVTQNQMTLQAICAAGVNCQVTGSDYEPRGEFGANNSPAVPQIHGS
jgi:hypothetical protein